jgi:putative acetyltransferase
VDLIIRNETGSDHRTVEELTREAFWNLYVQGCDEHYLVHNMRSHSDFIPELDFVAILENKIVGNIMYAKSHILDESNCRVEVITFGPVSVLPAFQRQGIGSTLICHSKKLALERGYKVIIIQGHPHNYCKHGFKSAKDYNISDADGKFPYSLLVLELEKGVLENHNWKYYPSDAYNIDADAAVEYDKLFEYKKKEYKYSQEEFLIASRAYIS